MDLGLVYVKTEDLDSAREFYEEVLDRKPSRVDGERMVYFDFEGVTLGILDPAEDDDEPDRVETGNTPVAGFSVSRYEEVRSRIETVTDILAEGESEGHRWFPSRIPTATSWKCTRAAKRI